MGGVVSLWGNPADHLPCWAGEGSGWPWSRIVTQRAGQFTVEERWQRSVAQLVLGHPITADMLGLRQSESWELGPGQYCKIGAGHIQGMMFYELLIDRHGVEGWLEWSRQSAERFEIRATFEDLFGTSMEAFARESDARTQRILGLR
jgi:hypothetical protein